MNLPWTLPALAQADFTHLSTLEYDLTQRALLIGVVYGIIVLIGLVLDVVLLAMARNRVWQWRDAVSRLVWRPWGLADSRIILAVLAVSYGIALLLGPHILSLANLFGLSMSSFMIILQSVVFHWVGLACVVLLVARRGFPWSSAFGFSWRGLPRAAGWGLVSLLAAMPIILFYTMLYHLLLEALGHHASLQDVAFAFSDEHRLWVRVYFFGLAVVIAPLFEEILFRGILLPVLAKRFGVTAAVIVVSVLFAAIHGHVPSMMTLFLLSVALSAGYIFTRSLMTSIVMHGLFNAVTVTILMTLK